MWFLVCSLMLVTQGHNYKNRFMGRSSIIGHHKQRVTNVFNSALEACGVHPNAHRTISVTKFSSMDFCDAQALEEALVRFCWGEHPEQGSEDNP